MRAWRMSGHRRWISHRLSVPGSEKVMEMIESLIARVRMMQTRESRQGPLNNRTKISSTCLSNLHCLDDLHVFGLCSSIDGYKIYSES